MLIDLKNGYENLKKMYELYRTDGKVQLDLLKGMAQLAVAINQLEPSRTVANPIQTLVQVEHSTNKIDELIELIDELNTRLKVLEDK